MVRWSRVWCFMLLASMACAGAPARPGGSSAVGQRLALEAPDLDGHDVDVGGASGKVRVIEFWATWCDPCKQAMPALDRVAAELGPRGVQVFGISVDEDRPRIVEFLRHHPVEFPVLWDKGAQRLSRLGLSFMPVTLLVDRRGVVRHVYQGWDAGRARRQRRDVEALLAEP